MFGGAGAGALQRVAGCRRSLLRTQELPGGSAHPPLAAGPRGQPCAFVLSGLLVERAPGRRMAGPWRDRGGPARAAPPANDSRWLLADGPKYSPHGHDRNPEEFKRSIAQTGFGYALCVAAKTVRCSPTKSRKPRFYWAFRSGQKEVRLSPQPMLHPCCTFVAH